MGKAFQDYRTLLERRGNWEQKHQDFMQLIDQFYGAEMVQYENDVPFIKGKSKLRDRENESLTKVTAIHVRMEEVEEDPTTDKITGRMVIQMTDHNGQTTLFKERFEQYWENGQIQTQKFFYHKPPIL